MARVVAVLGVWAALGASAAGAEWRDWCGSPGSEALLGWHFYCDRKEEVEPPPAPVPPSSEAETAATERIEAMRRALEEARAEAILDPTPEKVSAYLRLQPRRRCNGRPRSPTPSGAPFGRRTISTTR